MPKLQRLFSITTRLLYLVLALGVANYAVSYLFRFPNPLNSFDMNFAALRSLAVPGHFFLGALALALTPIQMSSFVRRRWPAIHRLSGLLYVLAVFLGGVSALRLAPDALFGNATQLGFVVLAILWLSFTAYAWQRILVRDYAGHGRWMYRSIALTASAITLRVILGIGVPLAGLPMATVYPIAAWACWPINLVVCEWLLRRPSGKRSVSFPQSA
ncbi:MAG: DUF2306 domain-containing protein [Pseudomonadota bacterium]